MLNENNIENILKCEKNDWYYIQGNGKKNWSKEKINNFNFALNSEIKDKKTIIFSGYTFPKIKFNAKFYENILIFENCKFEGDITFFCLNITSVEIKNCLFNDDITIDTYIGYLNINNCTFNGKFEINSNFEEDKIIEKLIIRENNYNGNFSIKNTQINLGIFEENSYNGKNNKFSNIIFGGAKFKNIEFNNFIFENIKCSDDLIYFYENIYFKENVVFRKVKLEWVSFLGANIENINFDYDNNDWIKINGRNVLFDEWIIYNYKNYYKKILDIGNYTFLEEYLHKNIGNLKYNYFLEIEKLYSQLKSNFESKKLWQIAGEFHIGEMDMKLKSLRYKSLGNENIFIGKLILGIYKIFSLYGESILRPLYGIIGVLFISIIFIYLLGYNDNFNGGFLDISLSILWIIFFQKDDNFSEFDIGLKYIISIIQIISPILLFLLALGIKRKIKR